MNFNRLENRVFNISSLFRLMNPVKRRVLYMFFILVIGVDTGLGQDILPPEYSNTRGFYDTPFYLTLTADSDSFNIRYTDNCSKPDQNEGILYTKPILISSITTIRAVAYKDSSDCSKVRTHSFIFPKNVLTQDNSGVPAEQHSRDHVFWTEEFDMSDVTQSEHEMIEALKDIPTIYISAPYDSIFGIAGIHRGQNLEEYGGDPHHPDWHELVECSAEMIYPDNYKNGQFKNWQEDCGIKIQGGAGRWDNGFLDHKQSFTLEFKERYGAKTLKNDFLVSAPFNKESGPKEFDKVILRTGFNRDWGSLWDPANYAYTRDQFARDLQILMSGWGNHGTYVHLYINGKYWGQYNPCERMDNHALATYFGGNSDDYFYGKGKGGIQFGSPDRYNYLNNTDWTNRQFSEIEEYLAVDTYIDNAIVNTLGNVGDGPQHYFGGRVNPPGPIYFTAWDMEDSFDGGARRTGPPVSMESYNIPSYGDDRFRAYFKLKNNIDFKMKFADRIYKHCYNDGILTDQRITAVWDSSCKTIEKSILCEIARWMDERSNTVYDYDHWKDECNDVREDLIGIAAKYVSEVKKTGMYPYIDPPIFKDGSKIISSNTINCDKNFSLTISMLFPPGKIYYTTDGSDPRKWDLSGGVSSSAIDASDYTTIPITEVTTIKARIKYENTWSPLHELKVIPNKTSRVVINEINYNSAPHFDPEDWIEIYNNTEEDIPLAGWKIMDSDDAHIFQFDQNTVLKKKSYLIVCRDTTAFLNVFKNVENYVGNLDFKFGNSGDSVRIYDNNYNLIDSLSYDNEKPWPISAAGKGSTLELINPEFNNAIPESWLASKGFGSPGDLNSTFILTDIDDEDPEQEVPRQFQLFQNYPNPFNPSTTIKYRIAKPGIVTLKVFNIVGQEVNTLVNDYKNIGTYSMRWDARGVASGIYLCRLTSKDYTATMKLILLK